MISEIRYNTRGNIIGYIRGFSPRVTDVYKCINDESCHNSITSKMALHIKNEYKLLTDLVISMVSFNQSERPSYDQILSTLKKVIDSINEDDTIIEKLKI